LVLVRHLRGRLERVLNKRSVRDVLAYLWRSTKMILEQKTGLPDSTKVFRSWDGILVETCELMFGGLVTMSTEWANSRKN
jgi:hypothetical protein